MRVLIMGASLSPPILDDVRTTEETPRFLKASAFVLPRQTDPRGLRERAFLRIATSVVSLSALAGDSPGDSFDQPGVGKATTPRESNGVFVPPLLPAAEVQSFAWTHRLVRGVDVVGRRGLWGRRGRGVIGRVG